MAILFENLPQEAPMVFANPRCRIKAVPGSHAFPAGYLNRIVTRIKARAARAA
jgi:hypothetical protein